MKIHTFVITLFIVISIIFYVKVYATMTEIVHPIPVRSVDTMKYSRDLAREKLNDPSFDKVIDQQVSQIALLGASHVSISTPYDEEFIPFLKRWIDAARRHSLNVWFRGNLSGWEGWFNYGRITSEQHTDLVEQFILNHADLFQDGDIFTSCPECENGGPGDPRFGNVSIYRKFLIREYLTTKTAFKNIGKKVTTNYYSMNGDVAKLVMDKPTVKALDGVITIDHYVGTPDELVRDIKSFVKEKGGKIVLGEMGAPIPDINGPMNEDQQAIWLAEAFLKLSNTPEVIGVNYWVNVGASTSLWNNDGSPKKGVEVLRNFYSKKMVKGKIVDNENTPVTDAIVTAADEVFTTAKNGTFTIPFMSSSQTFEVNAPGYRKKVITFDNYQKVQTVTLEDDGTRTNKKNQSFFSNIIKLFTSPFNL